MLTATMTLYLHRAERTDRLVTALGDLLSIPLPDPFATEIISVPTPWRGTLALPGLVAAARGPSLAAATAYAPVWTFPHLGDWWRALLQAPRMRRTLIRGSRIVPSGRYSG